MSRKENFAVSDKGSWSGQTPSASSASAEDPERSKTLFARVLPLPLPLTLWPLLSGRPELNCTERDKKCVAMRCFSLQIVIYCAVIDTGGPVFPLGCRFTRRDNLWAWRELLMNLYKLKSHIWFLEEYIHFERIYRVCRFDRLSWNFARTFQR